MSIVASAVHALNFRIPAAIHEEVKAQAKWQGRYINTQLAHLLDQALTLDYAGAFVEQDSKVDKMVSFRIPAELRERLGASADRHKRAIRSEINFLLRQALDEGLS